MDPCSRGYRRNFGIPFPFGETAHSNDDTDALSGLPEMRSIFVEKVAQGFYVNVDVNRPEAARYGLTIADVQTAVASGIGGQNIAENIEGRERYPINVRYQRDFRDNIEKMRGVLIGTPSRLQIPSGQVRASLSRMVLP